MGTRKKQATAAEIHAMRGRFKPRPGEKSFAEDWAESKREERELEERKFQRLSAVGKK